MSLKDKLFLSAIIIYTAILFFPAQQVLNFIATAIIVGISLFYNSWSEKKQLLRQRSYIWWMLVFFLLIFTSVLLSSNSNRGFRYLDTRLPLFYFPVSIGLIRLDRALRKKMLLAIASVITVITFICVGYGIYRAATFHDTAFLYNDALSEPVTGIQSIYVSMLVNIAIYILAWYTIYHSPSKYKFGFGLLVLLLFVCSFLLASRNLMVVLYLSTIIFGLYYAFSKKKYLEGATLIMGLLIGGFMIVRFFPKTINRFRELAYTRFDYKQTGPESHYNLALDSTQWNGANTRIAIWRCGWELFREHPVFGSPIGDKKTRLQAKYREKGFDFAIRTEKNLHNNYLDILVTLGIVGLLIFLIGWLLLPLQKAWRYRDGLAIVIILTFAVAMITEVYFDRSLGGTLFAFFIPFLLSDKISKNS